MDDYLSNEYKSSNEGLLALSQNVRTFTSNISPKLSAMEEKYFQMNPIYTEPIRRKINYLRGAYIYKFYLSVMHLEQLWALSHLNKPTPTVKDVLLNVYDHHQVKDDKLLLPSFTMEGFIIQGSTFLDFYFLHLCAIFNTSLEKQKLNKNSLTKALSNVNEPLKKKAKEVLCYCENKVFADSIKGNILSSNWGGIIKTLRNRMVHRDRYHPDYITGEPLSKSISEGLPDKMMDGTIAQFCNGLHNEMFKQIVELAEIVYGLEWIPGPYKPGLWD